MFTLAFWKRLGWSSLRTFVAASTVFVPALTSDFGRAGKGWLLTAGLATVVFVATSLNGLPDPAKYTWWQLGLLRAVRQAAQTVVGAAAGAALLTDVHWSMVLPAVASAAVTAFVVTTLTALPEFAVSTDLEGP